MDFDISDISPVGAVGGIIGGMLSFMMASSMMPNSGFGIGVKIITFLATTVACYFITEKILG